MVVSAKITGYNIGKKPKRRIDMTFAEKFYSLRKKSGLSQEECAEKLDVSRQAISRWEIGAATPDMQNLLAISRLFRVSSDWLIRDDLDEDEYEEKSEQSVPGATTEQKSSKYRHWPMSRTIFLLLPYAFCLMLATLAAFCIKSERGMFSISVLFASLYLYTFLISKVGPKTPFGRISEKSKRQFLSITRAAHIFAAFVIFIIFIGAPTSIKTNLSLYMFYIVLFILFKTQLTYTYGEKSEEAHAFRARDISFSIWFLMLAAAFFALTFLSEKYDAIPTYAYIATAASYIAICLPVTLISRKYIKPHNPEQ